ncbi:hypothetical protein [Coleofasciculus chthonoplastes]|uniref:hypothetical protein n=1 Tax=Coleofasciculus chthonoplastes TaxID=64178 RepID=UPI003301022F
MGFTLIIFCHKNVTSPEGAGVGCGVWGVGEETTSYTLREAHVTKPAPSELQIAI